jgi:SnoaL-like domain
MIGTGSLGHSREDEMMVHTEISPAEMADRLAIRELVDEYAHCADRRLAEQQKALFTPSVRFAVYMSGQGSEPTQVIDRREDLSPVFEDLNRYEATQHFNGQSTIELESTRATGESYCIAHHRFTEDGVRKLMVAHLRYDDTFIKERGAWLIAERNLYVDWVETRLAGV